MKTLRASLQNLSKANRTYYVVALLLRLAVSSLDMIGLALVGLAAGLITGATSLNDGPLSGVVNWLIGAGFENVYAVFGLVATLFFIAKALISVSLNSAIAGFLSRNESTESISLVKKLTRSNLSPLRNWNEKEVSLAINESTYVAHNYSLMAGSIIFGEGVLLLGICGFLLLQNAFLFVIMAAYFAAFAGAVSLIVNRRTSTAAKVLTAQSVRSNILIYDIYSLLRTLRAAGTGDSFIQAFADSRTAKATSQASINKLTYLPRYIVEGALMLGVAIILLQRSLDGGSSLPAATVAIFLAGAFRMVASLLPLQSSWAALRAVDEQAKFAFDLSDALQNVQSGPNSEPRGPVDKTMPSIEVVEMSFTYGQELPNVLEGVSLRIPFGSFVGVVGRSGAGKSTLTDLLLGFQEPTSGSVKIGNVNAGDYVLENPGLVAYVPQRSHIFSGSIIENVLLEIDPKNYDSVQLERALNATRMLDYVNSLPEGIHTRVGEGVRELSGGQAQRLSLTRALYRNPKILVLDETTSALDSKTKAEIESVIQELAGSMTIISITHNAKSLSDFDVVLEVKDGSVRSR